MAKRKTTKKTTKRKQRTVLHPKRPRISTGDAKKQVAEDSVTLAVGICDALETLGAERGKLGMILPPELIQKLELQEGEHFHHNGTACIMRPLSIPPVKLVELARKLLLTRQGPDQAEGTYIPINGIAWVHLYPEIL